MVVYLKVHLRLNKTFLCSSHTLISYMNNSLHIFVLSSSTILFPFFLLQLSPPFPMPHHIHTSIPTNSSLFLHHSSALPYCFGLRSTLEIPQQQPLNILRKFPMTSAGKNRKNGCTLNRSQINYQVEKK